MLGMTNKLYDKEGFSMESLLILLVLAWASLIMVRHFTKGFKKSAACSEECQNCPGVNSCTEKKKKS
jgi:hypothetical protein